jgi:hypothetical protein
VELANVFAAVELAHAESVESLASGVVEISTCGLNYFVMWSDIIIRILVICGLVNVELV